MTIPSGIRTPGTYVDFDLDTSRTGLPANIIRVLFLTIDTPLVEASGPVDLVDRSTARALYGHNSNAEKMIMAALTLSQTVDVQSFAIGNPNATPAPTPTPGITFNPAPDANGNVTGFDYTGREDIIIPVPSAANVSTDSMTLSIPAMGLFNQTFPLSELASFISNGELTIPGAYSYDGVTLAVTAQFTLNGTPGAIISGQVTGHGFGLVLSSDSSHSPAYATTIQMTVTPLAVGLTYTIALDQNGGTATGVVTPGDVAAGFVSVLCTGLTPYNNYNVTGSVTNGTRTSTGVIYGFQIGVTVGQTALTFPADTNGDGVLELGEAVNSPFTGRMAIPQYMTAGASWQAIYASPEGNVAQYIPPGYFGGNPTGATFAQGVLTSTDVANGYVDFSLGGGAQTSGAGSPPVTVAVTVNITQFAQTRQATAQLSFQDYQGIARAATPMATIPADTNNDGLVTLAEYFANDNPYHLHVPLPPYAHAGDQIFVYLAGGSAGVPLYIVTQADVTAGYADITLPLSYYSDVIISYGWVQNGSIVMSVDLSLAGHQGQYFPGFLNSLPITWMGASSSDSSPMILHFPVSSSLLGVPYTVTPTNTAGIVMPAPATGTVSATDVANGYVEVSLNIPRISGQAFQVSMGLVFGDATATEVASTNPVPVFNIPAG